MGDSAGGAVEADVAFVEDDGGVVGGKLGEGGSDVNHDAPRDIGGDEFEKSGEFAFGFGVDVLCEVVAEDEKGIADEGDSEEEAAVLDLSEF